MGISCCCCDVGSWRSWGESVTLSVKEAFRGEGEAPYLTVGEGAAGINARRAHALRRGNDWVCSRVGIRHFEGLWVNLIVCGRSATARELYSFVSRYRAETVELVTAKPVKGSKRCKRLYSEPSGKALVKLGDL
jgi:hypothetical protein